MSHITNNNHIITFMYYKNNTIFYASPKINENNKFKLNISISWTEIRT